MIVDERSLQDTAEPVKLQVGRDVQVRLLGFVPVQIVTSTVPADAGLSATT